MTPELRALAAGRFASVLAVDASPEAIERYHCDGDNTVLPQAA